jgi:uncharacterized repeat protein (TIGR03803 family)
MKKTRLAGIACIIAVFCVTTTVASHAQTFKSLLSFDGTDGSNPYSPLVEGNDGYFYGTTCCGGAYGSDVGGYGTVFRISRTGELTTIYNFCALTNCTDGSDPYAGMVLATNGNFYGTTVGGGTNNKGTVFKITPSGILTTLYSFSGGADGSAPTELTLAADGNLYGTTEFGANLCYGYGCGTVFKISTSGALTTLYTFCAQTNCTDGANPDAGVVQGNDGNFYGTSSDGGAYGLGTVFKITPSGTLTTLYSFCSQTNCPDGAHPSVGLVQARDGNFYGTTGSAGPHNFGTVFKITPAGAFTTVRGFCAQRNCLDGGNPDAALIQGSDGNLYGTTTSGGAAFFGFVFKMTLAGNLTPLYNFCSQANCADGSYPSAALIQATNGKLYGTTEWGGSYGLICDSRELPCGTLFDLSIGLPPVVEANPNAGKVGRSVAILGDNLTGSTSVTFNGISATFEVVSRSLIKATVPEGATTGTIQVTTPGGTLNSNIAFQVQP